MLRTPWRVVRVKARRADGVLSALYYTLCRIAHTGRSHMNAEWERSVSTLSCTNIAGYICLLLSMLENTHK